MEKKEIRVMTMGATTNNVLVPDATIMVQAKIDEFVLSLQCFEPDCGATDIFGEVILSTREALYLAHSIIKMHELDKKEV